MFKKLILFIAYAISSQALEMEGPFRSVLPDTKQTHDIATQLIVYQAYDSNGSIELIRIGKANDGGYVVPEVAIKQADVVLGYGVSNDISFEESTAKNYAKPSYGFDGTCKPVKSKEKLCQFIHQCIASKSAPSKENYSTFEQHLEWTHALNKKLFIKMDIEGDEYETLPDILKYSPMITGIVLEIHFLTPQEITKALALLRMLSRDYVLLHVHGNNNCVDRFVTRNSIGYIPRVLELTYINKNLLTYYAPKDNQDHPTSLDMSNVPNYPDAEFTILLPFQ